MQIYRSINVTKTNPVLIIIGRNCPLGMVLGWFETCIYRQWPFQLFDIFNLQKRCFFNWRKMLPSYKYTTQCITVYKKELTFIFSMTIAIVSRTTEFTQNSPEQLEGRFEPVWRQVSAKRLTFKLGAIISKYISKGQKWRKFAHRSSTNTLKYFCKDTEQSAVGKEIAPINAKEETTFQPRRRNNFRSTEKR